MNLVNQLNAERKAMSETGSHHLFMNISFFYMFFLIIEILPLPLECKNDYKSALSAAQPFLMKNRSQIKIISKR
jgi:hypothetical protein